MKKHYETHVEDTDKLISVAGPVLDYKSWYEQYRKLMEEQAQRKYGLYTPTSEGDDDDFPSIPGITARYSALGLTNEQMAENPVWKDLTGNGHDLQMKNFAWKGMSGVGGYGDENYQTFYKFTLDDYVFIATPPGVKHMNFTFRVTGLQPGNKLTLAFFGTTNTVPVKSLKAICSDGRCYDENWSLLKINVGEFTDNKGILFVASNGTNHAQIAFKNLGIYDNQILSKDDCIKAYNYLQTLKAK